MIKPVPPYFQAGGSQDAAPVGPAQTSPLIAAMLSMRQPQQAPAIDPMAAAKLAQTVFGKPATPPGNQAAAQAGIGARIGKWMAPAAGQNGWAMPGNSVPGTGMFNTDLLGQTYASAAAPGPNQIEPM